MKAISIIQPWASLIVIGAKHFETRGWKTTHRGPIAIHASKTKSPTGLLLCTQEPFKSVLAAAGIHAADQLPYGIIGTADLVDCLPTDEVYEHISDAEGRLGDYRRGRWAWKLDNATRLVNPIPTNGRQGIFEVGDLSLQPFYFPPIGTGGAK